jgi:hypothetical protein
MRSLFQLFGVVAVALGISFFTLAGIAAADPIADSKTRSATAGELQFIERVDKELSVLFPSPGEGWKVHWNLYKGQISVRPEKDVEFYGSESSSPVRLLWNIKFRLPSSVEAKAEKQEKEYTRSMEEIQQELMAAIGARDSAKAERLQLEMAQATQAQMESLMANMGTIGAPKQKKVPTRTAKEFMVTVSLNEGGEHIGKQYDTPTPGVTKSFRIERKGKVTYKHYIGEWDVRELNRTNWKIVFPKRLETAGNHLRSLALFVSIYGEKELVEAYVKEHFNSKGLNAMLR